MGNVSAKEIEQIHQKESLKVYQLELLYEELILSQLHKCEDSEALSIPSISNISFNPEELPSSQLQKQTMLDLFRICPEFAFTFYEYIKSRSTGGLVDRAHFLLSTKKLLGLSQRLGNPVDSHEDMSLLMYIIQVLVTADESENTQLLSRGSIRNVIRCVFKLFRLLPYFRLSPSKLKQFVNSITDQLEQNRQKAIKSKKSFKEDEEGSEFAKNEDLPKNKGRENKNKNYLKEELATLLLEYFPYLEESLLAALQCHLLFWRHPNYQKEPKNGLPLPSQSECLSTPLAQLWTHLKFFQSRSTNIEALFNSNLDHNGLSQGLRGYTGSALLLIKYQKEIDINIEEEEEDFEEMGFLKYQIKTKKITVDEIFGASVQIGDTNLEVVKSQGSVKENSVSDPSKANKNQNRAQARNLRDRDDGKTNVDISSKKLANSGEESSNSETNQNLKISLSEEKAFFYLSDQVVPLPPSGKEFLILRVKQKRASLVFGESHSNYLVISEETRKEQLSVERVFGNTRESLHPIAFELVATGTEEQIENWRIAQHGKQNLRKRVKKLIKIENRDKEDEYGSGAEEGD